MTPPYPHLLTVATGTGSVDEAIAWIADGHPIDPHADNHQLLRAVVAYGGNGEGMRAIRRLARVVAASDLDSSAVLFDPETIVPASRFRDALAELAARCPGGTLAGITASALIAAQRSDPFTLDAVCAVAGLSYKDLAEQVADLPSGAANVVGPSQLRRAFSVLDATVRGLTTTRLPGAVPVRPLELMDGIGLGMNGWEGVETLRTVGVPYEVLLAQRAAGGAWLSHRNRTSNKLGRIIADRLCEHLATNNVTFHRSTRIGGDISPSELSRLSGCDEQLGVLVLNPIGDPTFGVIVSVARDSGTASKTASRLRAMNRPPALPVAIVVAGPGWAARNETADLALDFGGRLYSERALSELVADIVSATSYERT